MRGNIRIVTQNGLLTDEQTDLPTDKHPLQFMCNDCDRIDEIIIKQDRKVNFLRFTYLPTI